MNDLLSPKLDYVFKQIFGEQKNSDILSAFLRAVIDLPEDEFDDVTIIEPHLNKESGDNKLDILDVKIQTKTGSVINVEIHICPFPEIRSRIMYYGAKMLTEQFASGYDYARIKRAICILITDFTLFNDSAYHHLFRPHDKNGLELSNLFEINTLELPLVPAAEDGSELWDWLSFIKAENKEAIEMIASNTKSEPIKKAVVKLKELSNDERTRMLAEAREKERRDYISRIARVHRDGEAEDKAGIAQ